MSNLALGGRGLHCSSVPVCPGSLFPGCLSHRSPNPSRSLNCALLGASSDFPRIQPHVSEAAARSSCFPHPPPPAGVSTAGMRMPGCLDESVPSERHWGLSQVGQTISKSFLLEINSEEILPRGLELKDLFSIY